MSILTINRNSGSPMDLIHCSYHKCLTVYYKRVFSTLYNYVFFLCGGCKHFNSLVDKFYENYKSVKVASINNHSLDLTRLTGDFRISRFIRDPRDMVVSGYFYHKAGRERWCNIVNPASENFNIVNGNIPSGMKKGLSFAAFLQELDEEDGLIAQIEFRKHHFESMAKWPMNHPKILTLKYEDVFQNESYAFNQIFSHYELPTFDRKIGSLLAEHFSAKKQSDKIAHIRNPQPNQWRKYFTPKVSNYFNQRYSHLLEMYGYC